MGDDCAKHSRPPKGNAAIGAIIAPCSSRKKSKPTRSARAVSLRVAAQPAVETAWLEKLRTFERPISAQDLYSGRGAGIARLCAAKTSAPLYIVSAGLGLVAGSTKVPTYGVTVARRGDDSIPLRIKGRFDPVPWWAAVCSGPVSTSLQQVLSKARGRIALLALTKPYAGMLAGALAALPGDLTVGLRIFGWRLEEDLPKALHGSIMNYDARLDAVLPGTRNDFAQRAMAHFVDVVLPLGGADCETHRRQVESALKGFVAPERITRPRASDDDILEWLKRPEQAVGGVGQLLRRVRDLGIACEQARFARLYSRTRQRTEEGMASL